MRRLVSNRLLPWTLTAFVCCLFAGGSANAQTEADTAADTAVVEEAPEDKSSGRVRISIDESGISVEGEAGVISDEDGDWVEIQDWRGEYKEKGLDIVKFGESVFVAKDELVRGDLVVFGGNVVVEGKVVGNVIAIGGDIRARSGAEIKGDAVVLGGELDEDEDVIIGGERVMLHDIFPAGGLWGVLGPDVKWLRFVVLPVGLFVQLILAFLVLLFLRERIFRGYDHLSDNYLKSFGVGLLASFIGVFALLLVMIPLVITIIGIPLALLLLVSCGGIFIISWTIFAYGLGSIVAKKLQIQSDNAFLLLFIGAFIIHLPGVIAFGISVTQVTIFVPIAWMFSALGWLIKAFAYLSGFGALILSRFGSRPLASLQQPAPPTPPVPNAAGSA